ncbi:XPG N-terminal domain/XPG I-region [Novymonas esmeraldas]|uniref:XPG N-terminal domain/XPG I-region n=1 Tax=Novymonas esmeraldas TaxID=1808958 RepID=A0AAW0ESL6_9TRYP
MGIKGLWQALREYVDDGHLSQFRGQRVAIDMYVWLHRCVHRSIRIRTEEVVAYLDAKYSIEVGGGGAATSASAATAAAAAASPPPPPLLDDIVMVGDQFVSLVVEKVTAVQRYGVIPVCVFDGAEMPMKGGTDEERRRRRTDAFHAALMKLEQLYCDARRRRQRRCDELFEGGGGAVEDPPITLLPREAPLFVEATQLLEKAIDISTELAHAVIQVLTEEHRVECIVAPYEADAQLAYLCREGYVAAAASEDSDLIAYYCPCIIAKLDTFTGRCAVLQPPQCAPRFFQRVAATGSTGGTAAQRPTSDRRGSEDGVSGTHAALRAAALQPVRQSHGAATGEEGPPAGSTAAAATAFTYESFLLGCIMSGCDYVLNLRSIGVKKAFRLVAHSTSLRQCFATLEHEFGFPAEELTRYRHRILEAFYCFAHHLVYSPITQQITTYHPLPALHGGATARLKTQLVGDLWPSQTAQEVCVQCLKDPSTLQLYRGQYQSCVAQYLQRSRGGQTTLNAYAGFQRLSSNRVVVHVGQRRERDAEGGEFGSPLQRHRIGSGFVGDRGGRRDAVLPPHAPPLLSASSQQQQARDVVVVRSRFFMLRGRTAVCERWSASDAEEDEEGEESADGDGAKPRRRVSLSVAGTAGDCDTAADRDALAALPHHPASSVSSHTNATAANGGSLGDDDAAASTAAAAVATTRLVDGRAGGRCEDGRRTAGDGTCALLGRPDRSSSSASTPANSAPSWTDSASTRDGEAEGEHASTATRTPAAGAEVRGDHCLADTPDVEPYTYAIASVAADVAATEAVTAAPLPSTPQCGCPFGYWQCNRAHSVFECCFLGQQWSRDAGPPSPALHHPPLSTAPASAAPSRPASPASPPLPPPPSPTGSGAGGYVPRAFRPPRSTAASAASEPAPLQPRNMNVAVEEETLPATARPAPPAPPLDGGLAGCSNVAATATAASSSASPLPSHRAAVRLAIFERMSFKKS